MGFLRSLTRTVIDVARLPIEVAKDVATLGGVATDQRKPYAAQKLSQIANDAEETAKSLDDVFGI